MKKIYILVFFLFVLLLPVHGVVEFRNDTSNFITICFPKENSCFFHYNQTILESGCSCCYLVASFRHGCTFFIEGDVAVKVTLTPEMCSQIGDYGYKISLSYNALVLMIEEYEPVSDQLRCRWYFPTKLIYGHDELTVCAHNSAAEALIAAQAAAEAARRHEEQERLKCEARLRELQEAKRLRCKERKQRQRAMRYIVGPHEEEKILEQEFARMRLQSYVCDCKKCR
ncbi:hypothetical protein K2W90_01485 [Candidatus Babeliales bacterium]|nr:hypothetical protein [Candidatus Babeliales bacterium]